jgi:hypothetical protein
LCKRKNQRKTHHERQLKACPFRTSYRYWPDNFQFAPFVDACRTYYGETQQVLRDLPGFVRGEIVLFVSFACAKERTKEKHTTNANRNFFLSHMPAPLS